MVRREQWDTYWGAKKIIFLIRDIDDATVAGVSSLLHSPNRLHEFEYLHQCHPHSPPPPQQLWCLS